MAAETKKTHKKEKNAVSSFLSGVTIYFGEVRSELNKVSWPNRDDVLSLTRIVLITTIVSSLVLGILSMLFALYIEKGLIYPIIFIVLFVAVIIVVGVYLRKDNRKVGY